MQRYQDVIVQKNGAVVSGVSVSVQVYPGGAPATIYSDDGVTVTANPLTTDANGAFEFYAADGHYQLVVSGSGITPKTISGITLADGSKAGDSALSAAASAADSARSQGLALASQVAAAASAVAAAASAALAQAGAIAMDPSSYLTKADNLNSVASKPNARTNLGLGNVDNTSDAEKPVSTAQENANTAVLNSAASDATTKANAAQVAAIAAAAADATAKANARQANLGFTPATEDSVSSLAQNAKSTDYTLVLTDAGKHILHPSADTTARTFTIPANTSVAFPIGKAVTFVNQNGAGAVTIAITTDTMRLAGAGTTGSRTLAANGMATALKITATEWIISGAGLT